GTSEPGPGTFHGKPCARGLPVPRNEGNPAVYRRERPVRRGGRQGADLQEEVRAMRVTQGRRALSGARYEAVVCGGSAGGKCEISPDVECIWDMIVRKLMDQGKTGELERLMPLKDWSTARDGGPRIRIKEDLRK
ncbi:MAG: methylenetetrahydrofolate reductase C-terminal domain-containing protein, partial [Proteobacteria bacterium]|nr:methylenetetrahydrofolate reductase C-terminal domain-containing protein [Pseudomonadota bacterium]